MNFSELSQSKRDDIKTYIKENYSGECSKEQVRERNNEIIDEVKKKFNCVITGSQIYEILSRVRKIREEIETINGELEENKFEADETHYIFNNGKLKFKILIGVVDDIFKDYSIHGHNLSSEEIRQKYNLRPGVFEKLKNALGLYKHSHVLSPISLERLSEGEVQNVIEDAIDEHIEDRYSQKFKTTFEKKKHQDYEKKSKILANIDSRMEHFQTFLQDYKPRDFSRYEVTPSTGTSEITVAFSDIHIGKMNTQAVLDRIEKMGKNICALPHSIVNMICLGDLAEILIKRGAHSGQIESMEDVYGFDLMMKVVTTLENLLLNVHLSGKTVRFYGIAGNHDSLEKNEGGFHGEGAYIMYELIKRGLKGVIDDIHTIREQWSAVQLDGMNIILNHGYARDTGKNSHQILWELGDKSKHNVILQGDKHHKFEIDPSDNATRLIVPALAGKGEYDKSLLLSSYPGYITIQKDQENGTPITTTHRFSNI